MKLNLVEINKLSPPLLWDLGALSVLISALLGVIKARVGGSQSVHFYARMVVRLTNELRAKTRENLNMRIKAWVLLCPERIAWVRGIIGEVAIRRWRKNRLADYALSKYFGDWQSKWPNGFARPDDKQYRTFSRTYKYENRTYNWKPFALTRIVNAERILFGQTRPDPQAGEIRAAYYKLWGTDIQETPTRTWSHQVSWRRESRALKPVEFTPYELGVGIQGEAEADSVKQIGAVKIYPPPRLKTKYEYDYEDEDENKPP